jgi:UDP-2,3-diacylglucosamine pyrophosphatase LpxH
MDEPVRILSDLHLGHRISRIAEVEALRSLIAGARTVIFNGDTWQELAKPLYQRSREMLEELKSLCREEGVEPVFLSGNHDPGWPGNGWLELAGGRIIITHGDALSDSGSPWKREILTHGDLVGTLWQRYPDARQNAVQRIQLARLIARELKSLHHPSGKSLIQRAWDAMMPPTRALRIIEAWTTQGKAGSAFCDRYFPQAEFLIIGHFHWDGSWKAGGRRVINTGSFVAPGPARWVEWNDGWLSQGRIDRNAGIYRIGRTLDVWRLS